MRFSQKAHQTMIETILIIYIQNEADFVSGIQFYFWIDN